MLTCEIHKGLYFIVIISSFINLFFYLSGERVQSIKGNQRTKAIFTILPPANVEATIDIVREVAFVSSDGSDWRADG